MGLSRRTAGPGDSIVARMEGPIALTAGSEPPPGHHDAFRVLWDYLVPVDQPTVSDVIFCFGSRDHTVPARAAELFVLGVAPWVLVSGGVSFDGRRSESEAFADDLCSFGVPRDRIIVEGASTNTGQNVILGMAALSSEMDVGRITAVSWPLAARRCRATFARWFPQVEVWSSPSHGGEDERWQATDRTMRAALGELDRLARYAEAGFLCEQPVPTAVRQAAEALRGRAVQATEVTRSCPVAVRVPTFSEDLAHLDERPVGGDDRDDTVGLLDGVV